MRSERARGRATPTPSNASRLETDGVIVRNLETTTSPAVDARDVCDVAIVGAGGGLAAALALQRRGYDVRVFERRRFDGGRRGVHLAARTGAPEAHRRRARAAWRRAPRSTPSRSSSTPARPSRRNCSLSTSRAGPSAWTSAADRHHLGEAHRRAAPDSNPEPSARTRATACATTRAGRHLTFAPTRSARPRRRPRARLCVVGADGRLQARAAAFGEV